MNRHQVYGRNYQGTAAENYQRFFVPAIGAPVAFDRHSTVRRAKTQA